MSYWDLSEKERSSLERKDVESYIGFELMHAGVLMPTALELVEEPEMPDPDMEVYTAQCGYHHSEVAFESHEKARTSIVGSLGQLHTKQYGDYTHGVTVSMLRPFDKDTNDGDVIRRVPVYSDVRIAQVQQALEAATAARAENSRRRAAHAEESSKADKALQGMWDNWHACRAKAAEMNRVNTTRAQYLEMSKGNEEIAHGFLLKAFDVDTVKEAEEWLT